MSERVLAGRPNVSNSSSSVAKETSWLRWLPGLATLRSYELGWLTHDLVAEIVLTTMLAPVGIAYAVASGVGPSMASTPQSLVCWPTRSSDPVGSWCSDRTPHWRQLYSGSSPRYPGAIRSRDRDRRRDGACLWGDPYRRRDCSARFRNRASVEADPLRLHEWNRADCADQSAAQTARI